MARRTICCAVLLSAFAALPQSARGQFDRTWNLCDGVAVNFCVALGLTAVSPTTVRTSVWNYSGLAGTGSTASAGVFQGAFTGLGGNSLVGPPVFRDAGAGYADAFGALSGGTMFRQSGWDPSQSTYPQLIGGRLLYAQGGLFSWGGQSLGVDVIGSGCPGGWGFNQQSSVQFWQNPCSQPAINDPNHLGWVSFDAEFTAPVDLSSWQLASVCGYSFGQADCINESGSIYPVSVPEPSTYLLMLTGIMGLGLVAWRRRESLV